MSGTLSDLVNRQPVNGGIPITNLRVHGDLLRIVGALKLAVDLVLVLLHNLAQDLLHAYAFRFDIGETRAVDC